MEWKGNSGKATESGFQAWFWFLGKQSRKQRLRCHFFVRKGDLREQDGGKEERVQEGQGASPECALGAGHGLVTNVTGWSVSQDCPLRSCINEFLSSVVQRRRRGRECVHRLPSSFGSLTGCSLLGLPGCAWVDAASHCPNVKGSPKGKTCGARGQRPEAAGLCVGRPGLGPCRSSGLNRARGWWPTAPR